MDQFSIIIPNYNKELYIRETLNSVLNQSYKNWECFIVDDGSTDKSLAIIDEFVKKDNRFVVLNKTSGEIKGPSSSRNLGIRMASGDYVIFLDSDDLLEPYCLEHRLNFVRQNPCYDFWIFKMNVLDKSIKTEILSNILPLDKLVDETVFYKSEFLKGNHPFSVTAPLWRKEVLNILKGFDESFAMLEDPDLHLRALKNKFICNTAHELSHDCYYRVNYKSQELTKKIRKNIFVSQVHFLNKHSEINNEEITFLFYKVLRSFVLTSSSLTSFFKMLVIGRKLNVLSFRKVLIASVMFIYGCLNLDQINGLGYNKLSKMIK